MKVHGKSSSPYLTKYFIVSLIAIISIVLFVMYGENGFSMLRYQIYSYFGNNNLEELYFDIGLDSLNNISEEYVSGSLLNDDYFDIKIGFLDGSYHVYIQDDLALDGMKSFLIKEADLLDDWLYFNVMRNENVLAPRYQLSSAYLNGEAFGVIGIQEYPFLKELSESMGYRESVISTCEDVQVANGFSCNSFDCQAYGRYFALKDVFENDDAGSLFYYNPVTGLIEPIAYSSESDCDDDLFDLLSLDDKFLYFYQSELLRITDDDFLDNYKDIYEDDVSNLEKIVSWQVSGYNFEPFWDYDDEIEIIEGDYFSADEFVAPYDFFVVNGSEITIPKGNWQITEDVVIPYGYTLVIQPGTTLELGSNVSFFSYSPVQIAGTENEHIVIKASNDEPWSVFGIFNAEGASTLAYVDISGGSEFSEIGRSLTGGVTFFRSDVEINNTSIYDMHGEDGLNIIESEFEIRDVVLSDIASDGFDSDFCVGFIDGMEFYNMGNDALDVSGTEIEVHHLTVMNAGDKGISAGEGSNVFVYDSSIKNVFIGLASKDLAHLTSSELQIEEAYFDLAAYKKKNEFGPGNIEFISSNSVNFDNVLVHENSVVNINGEFIEFNRSYDHDVFEELTILQL